MFFPNWILDLDFIISELALMTFTMNLWLCHLAYQMHQLQHYECSIYQFIKKICHHIFDDILVYNPSVDEHIVHLETIFEVLKENQLVVKFSKCH